MRLCLSSNHIIVLRNIVLSSHRIVCSPLVLLVDKVLRLTYDNRLSNQLSGAWIQCSAGAGRSAVLALLCLVVCQVRAGQLRLCGMYPAACYIQCCFAKTLRLKICVIKSGTRRSVEEPRTLT